MPTNLENTLLMIPGPVPVASRILRAMSRPMINHRGKEFGDMYRESVDILAELFKTKNDIFIISGSGSCAMEAAVGNVIGENDTLVAVENGKFGERFIEIGKRYGNVVPVKFEWGSSIELDAVESALEEGAKAVTLVHNETSTGIRNPAREIGKLAKKYGALFIMDGITSIGGDNVPVDDWGIDIAIVGSQKCIGAPPGLAAVSVSQKAWDSIIEKPPYYMDLKAYRKSAKKDPMQTPYTPAVPLFFAMHEALKIVREEGIDERIKRHASFSEAVRSAALAMGLELFPQLNDVSSYSNTVTAMKLPSGMDEKKLKNGVKELGVQISGGQDRLQDKIFRIGGMGNISKTDILVTISAVELTLHRYGAIAGFGAGVEAADSVLAKKSVNN